MIVASIFFVASSAIITPEALEMLKHDCVELAGIFDEKRLNYSYKDFQNREFTATPAFRLDADSCSSSFRLVKFDAYKVGSASTPQLRITFNMERAEEGLKFSVDYDGNCADVASEAYIQRLSELGTVITPELYRQIKTNYRDIACPALVKALSDELTKIGN